MLVIFEKLFRQKSLLFLEKGLFFAFLAIIPFSTNNFFFKNYLPDTILFIVLVLSLMNHYFKNWNFLFLRNFFKNLTKNKKPLSIVFLSGFLIWSVLSLIWASDTKEAFILWLHLIEAGLLLVYIKFNFKNYKLNHIFSVLVVSALFQASIGIFQFLGFFNQGFELLNINNFNLIRARGTFFSADTYAVFLIAATFLNYWLILRQRFFEDYIDLRHLDKFEEKRLIWASLMRIVLLAALFILLLGLVLSFSRFAIILLILGTLIFILFLIFEKKLLSKNYYFRARYLLVAFAIFLGLIIISLMPELQGLFNQRLLAQDINFNISFNRLAIDFIKNNPIFGVGLANFDTSGLKEFLTIGVLQGQSLNLVQNIYLLVATETGLIGFTLFAALLAAALYGQLISFLPLVLPDQKLLHFTILILFLALLVFGAVSSIYLLTQGGRFLFFLILGIIFSLVESKNQESF